MNLEERNKLAVKYFDDCLTILTKKGVDYSPEGSAFGDLDEIAKELGIPATKVMWVFLRKHYTAIRRYIKTGRLESEPIAERLKDLANYCFLLHALIIRDGNAETKL